MAQHAPGLPPSELERMTPEQTRYLRKRVDEDLEAEGKLQFAQIKLLVTAASAGRMRL